MLRALLEYNPLLDVRDNNGNTALHCIISATPTSSVKLLLNAGANPEICNNFGYTPVCRAAEMDNIDVAKYLISKKVEINVVDGAAGGPLHLACSSASLRLVKVLIDSGADANKSVDVNLADPSITGTPLISACYREPDASNEVKKQIIRYLIEEVKVDINRYSGALGNAINVACLTSTPEIISLLLKNGATSDVEDRMGHKPIHLASFRTLDHIQPLLDAGEQVTATDKLGRTPLHYAVVSGRVNLVERILNLSGGSVDTPDFDDWTPLLWAARVCGKWETTSSEQAKIIGLLLARGADLWVRGKGLDRDWSPLKVARYYGAAERVIELLTPKLKRRANKRGEEESWDERFHLSKEAVGNSSGYCDGCLLVSFPAIILSHSKSLVHSPIRPNQTLLTDKLQGLWGLFSSF
jgi:ankyrin repeat protein